MPHPGTCFSRSLAREPPRRAGRPGSGARGGGAAGRRRERAVGRPPGDARIPRESDSSGRRGIRLGLRSRRVLGDSQEELRRLLVEALVPLAEAPVRRAPRESRCRPLRSHGGGTARVAGGACPFRARAPLPPGIKVVNAFPSAPDVGLSTCLNWPLYNPRSPSTSGGTMISLAPEVKEGDACILVVDDDEGVRENLAELFEVVGYSVLTAGNAVEAMEKLSVHEADLLLTDYRMPGPNGGGLIESARRTKTRMRTGLLTAFGDSFSEIESVRRGAICYLNKPFEADEITGLVARILALKGE